MKTFFGVLKLKDFVRVLKIITQLVILGGFWLPEMCFCVEFFGSLRSWEKEGVFFWEGVCRFVCDQGLEVVCVMLSFEW